MGRTSQAWGEYQKTVKSHQTRKQTNTCKDLGTFTWDSKSISQTAAWLYWLQQQQGFPVETMLWVLRYLSKPSSKLSVLGESTGYLRSENFFLPGLRISYSCFILSNNRRDFWGIAAVSYRQPINIISFCCSVTQWRTKMLLSSEWRSSWWHILLQEKGVFSDSGEMGVEKWWKKCQGCWMCLTFLKLE